MNSLKEDFDQITVGSQTTFRNLTVFPILRPRAECIEADYLLAEDAIAHGVAKITELGSQGSVPELRFENNSPKAVLLLDGEELVGAKQNRVLNLTILAPPQAVTVIPVSCVEAGRWSMQSESFAPAQHVLCAHIRAAKTRQVTRSMHSTGTRHSDQSAVWNDIAAKASRMDTDSPTQAMAAVYEKHAAPTEEYVGAFECAPLQAGVAFGIDGRMVGLDLFDHPDTFRRLFPKLLRSYALDALEAAMSPTPRVISGSSIDEVLQHIAAAPTFAEPALGLGKDLRFSGELFSGGALWASDRFIHVCAFSTRDSDLEGTTHTNISRPTRRRRH